MSPRIPRLLLIMMAVAWIVRGALAVKGGQLTIPDEYRYFRAPRALQHLAHGEPGAALDTALDAELHVGFTVFALPPAIGQWVVYRALGAPFHTTYWIPALFFSLLSVGCIGLTYAIALRTGAERDEGLVAAGLMASSTSLTYFARHLVPYDCSMALGLTGLWLGLGEPSRTRFFLTGLVLGACYLTYYGYWSLVAVVAVLLCLVRPPRRNLGMAAAAAAERALVLGAGFAVPAVLLEALCRLRGLDTLTDRMRFGAKTVVVGIFSEGWSLPWEYSWHAEHGLLLVWLASGGIALAMAARGRSPGHRAAYWGGAFLGLYLLLTLASSGLGRFVVCGRFTRPLVPFACLLTAVVVGRVPVWGRGRPALGLAGAALCLQFVYNMWVPWHQEFPQAVIARVMRTYGDVPRACTTIGTWDGMPLTYLAPLPTYLLDGAPPVTGRYLLLNAQWLWPVDRLQPDPPGQVLFRVPHFLQYRPYQYEGSTPAERAILNRADISMRLIRLADR